MWGDRSSSLDLDRVLPKGVVKVSRKRPDKSTNWKTTKLAKIRSLERRSIDSDNANIDEENIKS